MAIDARAVAFVRRALLEEDRLDASAVELEVEAGCAGRRAGRLCGAGLDPRDERLEFSIALRLPVLPAGMERIAAGLLGERMHQQAAGHRIAGHDDSLPRLEVLPRLLDVPGGRALGQGDQARLAGGMTGDAACVSRPLREEDRLDPRFEELEVERRRGRRRRRPLSGGWLLAAEPG